MHRVRRGDSERNVFLWELLIKKALLEALLFSFSGLVCAFRFASLSPFN